MARTSVRDLWKAKLEGKLPPAAGNFSMDGRRKPFRGMVLGIDPSLRGTGLALIEFVPGKPHLLLHSRTVRVRTAAGMPECLGEIFRSVDRILNDYLVDHVALEQTIYVQNFQTAQILGAARGAAIAAAAIAEKPVFEYPPLRVKQAVVGVGRASKQQMAKMVMGMLGHGRTLSADEADAAGVALCHAMTYQGDGE